MKKKFWKIEYSVTFFVVFGVVLLMLPTTFITHRGATYISKWNETYRKVDYMFTAMATQANDDILKSFKRAKTHQQREHLMITLTKPYLRLSEDDKLEKRYAPKYLNGKKISTKDVYYFDKYYKSKNGIVLGIKDLDNEKPFEPGFIMMFDMNGTKPPNYWGRDIYGINIYSDGKITPIGYNWNIDKLKNDCSDKGTGVACSYYYRIGGEFIE